MNLYTVTFLPFLIVTNSPDKGKNSVCTFMLKFNDEITCGPSSEFKNQFLTGKLPYLLSQHLNLPVFWKYFATLHGKGIVDGIGGAAKSKVREKVRNKGKGSIVVQSSVDFATVAPKLLPNVEIIHIGRNSVQYHKIGSMEHCL